ncbi:MAG: hypothetical protein CVU11_14095 [Bacteroidetes bacterium HGW-Bacteroidetes-6]|jgi:hypothetical protein|nr:MAG: hypothetical protein CVU11_14095 [Bacteroidetes bacterium HGW-Bacteroidetes-6]
MSRYNGPNVGGILEVRVYTYDQIGSISDPINNNVTLTLLSGVSSDALPVTPETAAPDIVGNETEHGNLWPIKFPIELPKVDSNSRAIVSALSGKNCIVVYKLNTGIQFILGSEEMPLRCVEVKPNQSSQSAGGTNYNLSFEGFSLNDPYTCTIVAP